MTTGAVGLAPAAREDARRFIVSVAVSIVVHLLLLIVITFWLGVEGFTIERPDVEVPLVFETPVADTPPPMAPTGERQQQPAADERSEPALDDSLLGFRSEGEIEGRPVRPVGPSAEIHGMPPPGSETTEVDEPPLEPADAEPQAVSSALEGGDAIELPAPEPPPDLRENDGPDAQTVEIDEPVIARPIQPFESAAPDQLPPDERAPSPGDNVTPHPVEPREVERTRPPAPAPATPRRLPRRGPQGPGRGIDYDVDIHGGMFDQNIQFDSPDFDWSEYSTKVYFAVWRAWLRELLGRARRFERDQSLASLPRLADQVDIHFVINRNGNVTGVEVIRPSSIPTLDEASSAALLRAVLPPLPADFPRGAEGVTFRFILSIDSALQMERQLKQLQQRGEF